MPPLEQDHVNLLFEKGELESNTETTNDPYDIILGQLYEDLKGEENKSNENAGDDGGDDAATEGLPDAVKDAIQRRS